MRFPHSVTVIRAALVSDGKGGQRRDWTSTTATSSSAWVQPVSSTEDTDGQERVVARWRIFLPAGADVLSTDRIGFSGDTYFVDGEVQPWDSGTGPHHAEAFLRRVDGG